VPVGGEPAAGGAVYQFVQAPDLGGIADSVGGMNNLAIGAIIAIIAIVLIGAKIKK
jgi:hypothetical protein